MKQFVDDVYVGFGKLVYDDPLCTWLAEHDLQVRGYRRIVIPHIRTVGETDQDKGTPELASWPSIVANNVDLMVSGIRDLPLRLYAIWTFDGGMTLFPFEVRQGTAVRTNMRDSSNNRVFVDIVAESPIRLF